MKLRILFLFLAITFSLSVFSQKKRVGTQFYSTVSDIQNETLVPRPNDMIVVTAIGKSYYFDPTSVATHDDVSVIKQNSITTGRFVFLGSGVSSATIQQINTTGSVIAWNSTVEIGATPLTANTILTLPSCVANIGKSITFKRLDNAPFTVVILPNGNETTEIITGTFLNSQYASVTIQAVSATKSEQINNINTYGIVGGLKILPFVTAPSYPKNVLQSLYNLSAVTAPDIVPQEVCDYASSLNVNFFKIYLGQNKWWYTTIQTGITPANWTLFNAGGKDDFGTGVVPNGIITFGIGNVEKDPLVKAVNGIVKSNGTTISAAVATDFPILNQNTTGTSANVTGIVPIANGGTGSSTQNFVDLTTNQTVAGNKTFNGNTTIRYTSGVGSTTSPLSFINQNNLKTFSFGTDNATNEGQISLQAPSGQGAGSSINFKSGVGGTVKDAYIQMDDFSNFRMRNLTPGGTTYMDYDTGGHFFRNSTLQPTMFLSESLRVGIVTNNPLSNLDNAGSLGLKTFSTSNATYTISDNDYEVVLTSAGTQTVTLPAVNNIRRVVKLVNNTATATKTVTAYQDFTNTSATEIPANGSITLHSNGATWALTDRSLNTTSSGWGLTGNAATVAGTNYIGTSDAIRFDTRTANIIRSSYSATGEFSVGTIGIKVGGSSYASAKQNIEYSDNTAVGATAVDGLAIYNGINGANATTRMTLWNTNVTNAFLQYNNAAYTGLGGAGSFVIGTSLGSNAATVIATMGTERIRFTPSGDIGINNTLPASSLDIVGSIGTGQTTVNTATYTASSTDNNIILTLAGLQTITLPAVLPAIRREYKIVNPTATVKAFSAVVTDLNGLTTTVIPANGSMTIKSDGGVWRITESSSTKITRSYVRCSGSGTQNFGASPGTTLTNWTELQDVNNNFAAGIFSASRTGYYMVNAQVWVSTSTMGLGGRLGVIVSVNNSGFGANNPIHTFYAATANPSSFAVKVSELKFLNAGDNIRLNAFLDAATAATSDGNANFHFLTIAEMPASY